METTLDSGYFIWMLTITVLAALLFYNGLIYFYSRIKSFLFYAIYTFFLLIYIGSKRDLFNMDWLTGVPASDNWPIQIVYNLAYLQFFRYFLDLSENRESLDKLLRWFFNISLGVSILVYLTLRFTGNLYLYGDYFLYVFLPSILLLSIYSLYDVTKLKNNLKYFVIFGAGIYILFGITAIYLSENKLQIWGFKGIIVFYVGIIIENALFSMGLGRQIKNIADERMYAKQMLIEQLQENDKIKQEANTNLEREVTEKTRALVEAIRERESEKIERLRVQYEQQITELNLVALRSQMNPHFIFNALNTIKAAIINEQKLEAVSYLNKFSKLIREILRNPGDGLYTLEKELSILKVYLNLENIRLQKKINLQINTTGEIDFSRHKIPPLLLQPLVENAIWHGLSQINDKDRKIDIHLQRIGDYIYISIEDNGIGLKKAQEIRASKIFQRESIGIKLVTDRLKLFAQQQQKDYEILYTDLTEEKSTESGTRVEIKLPG